MSTPTGEAFCAFCGKFIGSNIFTNEPLMCGECRRNQLKKLEHAAWHSFVAPGDDGDPKAIEVVDNGVRIAELEAEVARLTRDLERLRAYITEEFAFCPECGTTDDPHDDGCEYETAAMISTRAALAGEE